MKQESLSFNGFLSNFDVWHVDDYYDNITLLAPLHYYLHMCRSIIIGISWKKEADNWWPFIQFWCVIYMKDQCDVTIIADIMIMASMFHYQHE